MAGVGISRRQTLGESSCGSKSRWQWSPSSVFRSCSTDLRADEEKIAFEKLPAAVKKTIKRKFPKAEIEGASKEVEDGTTTYEVELEIKDRSVDVALKADGTILEIEREVPVDELPKAVKKALAARYPKAKIEKVEEIVKGEDGPVHYEVAIKAEVVLTAKGKFVKARRRERMRSRPRKPGSPRRMRTKMMKTRTTRMRRRPRRATRIDLGEGPASACFAAIPGRVESWESAS